MARSPEIAKIDTLTLKAFTGLDLRRLPEATSPEACIACSNVSVGTNGSLESRAPLRRVAVLDSESVGLYVVNNELHAALPYPDPTDRSVPRPPAGITYDLLCDSGSGFAGTLSALADSASWENNPYLCVATTTPNGVRYRHYYPRSSAAAFGVTASQAGDDLTLVSLDPAVVPDSTAWLLGYGGSYLVTAVVGSTVTLVPSPPTLPGPTAITFFVPTRNRVDLPFEPGSALQTAAGKVWAPDRLGSFVWGSSTEFGPTDWVAVDDACSIPTSQHAGGDLPIEGLGIFRDKLVVFYERYAQFWTVDQYPDNIEIADVVGGAGTRHPGSIANVQGDLYYFGDGTFRMLSSVITTGQPKEGDQLGSRIAALTKLLSRAIRPAAVWSSRLQQYLCAFEDEVFAFTQAVDGSSGWGRWDLPFPVSHMVENNGVVYVRRSDEPEVWAFDAASQDEDVAWSTELGAVDCDQPGTFKRFVLMDMAMTGEAAVAMGTNVKDLTEVTEVADIDGTTAGTMRTPLFLTADHLLPRFSGSGPWRLDQLVLRYRQGGFA